jgi:steroid delta-isomerase
MSPEIVSQTVKDYFAALRAMDEQAWINTFAEDAISNDPVGAPPIVGHQKIRKFFQSVTAAFKEVGLTENDVFIVGNTAAVKWTGRGISKQGRAVHFEGIDIIQLNEAGKVQTVDAYWNPAEMMAQL